MKTRHLTSPRADPLLRFRGRVERRQPAVLSRFFGSVNALGSPVRDEIGTEFSVNQVGEVGDDPWAVTHCTGE